MLRTALVASTLALAFTACGPNLCEQSQKVGSASEGDCGSEFAGPLLGASCSSNLQQCSEADQKVLSSTLTCLEKIATCNLIAKDAWALQRDSCTAGLTTSLSEACLQAFFMGKPPGFDAGVPDAGPQPILDGGNGLSLVAVSNESTVALAWEPRRAADVQRWMLVQTDLLGDNRVETEFTPGTAVNLRIDDAGMNGRRYFLVGLGASGEVLTGMPFSAMGADAGVPMCMGPNDCANTQVCDLGTCRAQSCQPGMANTCPPGYACPPSAVCERTSADGGVFMGGGGRPDAGMGPLPMISNLVELTPRPPMVTPTVTVGGFAALRPDLAAFDTARVAVGLEQEGQLIAHPSFNRGRDLENEAVTSVNLDTVGSRLHLAWNLESRALYACYIVGRGVRVQKSVDDGRTWGVTAFTFEPPAVDDGGVSETIRDCDIAAYKNGGAIMVTAETEQLVVREFNQDLVVTRTSPAFTSIPVDAGVMSIAFPSHPAIAAQPSTGLVHVTFTATRLLTGGVADTEPYGVFREGTAQSFTTPTRMTPVASASALPEDWTTVTIHPTTGRAIGAFTSVQAVTNNSTVYVSLFNPTSRSWNTGSHLNVFVVDQNTSVWLPQKAPTDVWYAFSPQFAPLPDGTFAFSFVAGPHTGSVGDYRQYLVPFDLDRTAAITSGRGWFIPPVLKVSDERVLDPRGGQASPQPPVTALTADSQISVYGTFIVGSGASGDAPSPARFFSWP